MTTAASSVPLTDLHRPRVALVLKAGLVAGVLDITATGLLYVGILRLRTFTQLWQSIASGLLGKAAFEGGVATAALGVALHFFIALGWATLFALAARQWSGLRRQLSSRAGAALAGLAYGALVWLVMNFVVLALSRAAPAPLGSWRFWVQLGIHMVCVGLPIAYLQRPARR